MKIQILTSKSSWLFKNKKKSIIKKLKKYSKKVFLTTNLSKLKKKTDITIILSRYKIIPKKYLNISKHNLIVHESDLPKGRGMSPMYRQILRNKKKITFTIFECTKKMDEGFFYYKKEFFFKESLIYKELKELQFLFSMRLIIKFLNYYKKNNSSPKKFKQIGKATYFKKLRKIDSKINIRKSLKSQFNRLRTVDNKNFPAFFYYKKRKFFIKISLNKNFE